MPNKPGKRKRSHWRDRSKFRIVGGEQGPTTKTLLKTVDKRSRRIVSQAMKLGINPSALEFISKKRLRQDMRIAASRALNAIGLDPKNAFDKALRVKVNKAIQKTADLNYYANTHPDRRFDPETHAELKKIQTDIVTDIYTAKGEAAMRKFTKTFDDHINTIEIIHGELAMRRKK